VTLPDLAIIGILGAVLGLDVVAFPQAMLSRPLVACTVAAGFLGSAPAGLLLGALVEFFALETLPVGASRYPEWGSSSAVGGALVASEPTLSAGGLLVAVLGTLVMAWAGGWSMVQLRRLNALWARRRHDAIARGSRRVVVGLQLFGLSADLLRAGLMTMAGIAVFAPLYQRAIAQWGLPEPTTRLLLVGIAGTTAAGAVYKVFHGTAHTRWFFLSGLALGAAVLVMR
jgi:mannose/fructose/N-acetylgalactosamine-specific phosphotransferase system component IIC